MNTSVKSTVQLLLRGHELVRDHSLIRTVLCSVVLLSMASAGWRLWISCQLRVESLILPFAIAVGLATLHRFVNAYGWALVLRSMGFAVDGMMATRVWLMAESRRWLPGGVWGYASRATMANRLQISSVAAAASMLLELMLVVLAAAVVTFAGAGMCQGALEIHFSRLPGNQFLVYFAGILLTFFMTTWLCRSFIVAKSKTVMKRFHDLRTMRVSFRGVSVASLFFVMMNLLGGLITVVLTRSVPGGETIPVVAVLAASSAAWCIGFFAFLSPGGLLVREAALAMMLLPWIAYTDGLTLAVLTRLAQLIAEGIAIVVLWMMQVGPRWIQRSPQSQF